MTHALAYADPHRAGTAVVVSSLYYQSANKAKEGKATHKEQHKPSEVLHRSAGGAHSSGGGAKRDRATSFAGVGQVPRAAVGQDEESTESAVLLAHKGGSEQR
jgi:hypothetical protein